MASKNIEVYCADKRVINTFAWNNYQLPIRGSRDGLARVVLPLIGACFSIDQVVDQIMQCVKPGNGESMTVLRILGHGNSDIIQMGTGLRAMTCSAFRRLRPFWNDSKRSIELHSCDVARGAADRARWGVSIDGSLGATLAQEADAPVTAAISDQYIDRGYNFEGKTMTFLPGGGFTYGVGWYPGYGQGAN